MILGSLSNDNGNATRTSQICIFSGQTNSFARPARAFFTFVHLFAVVSKQQREIAKFEVLRRTSALQDKVSSFVFVLVAVAVVVA